MLGKLKFNSTSASANTVDSYKRSIVNQASPGFSCNIVPVIVLSNYWFTVELTAKGKVEVLVDWWEIDPVYMSRIIVFIKISSIFTFC